MFCMSDTTVRAILCPCQSCSFTILHNVEVMVWSTGMHVSTLPRVNQLLVAQAAACRSSVWDSLLVAQAAACRSSVWDSLLVAQAAACRSSVWDSLLVAQAAACRLSVWDSLLVAQAAACRSSVWDLPTA